MLEATSPTFSALLPVVALNLGNSGCNVRLQTGRSVTHITGGSLFVPSGLGDLTVAPIYGLLGGGVKGARVVRAASARGGCRAEGFCAMAEEA